MTVHSELVLRQESLRGRELAFTLEDWEGRQEPDIRAECPRVDADSEFTLTVNPAQVAAQAGLRRGRSWEILVGVSGSRDEPVRFTGIFGRNDQREKLSLGRIFSWAFAWVRLELVMKVYDPTSQRQRARRFVGPWLTVEGGVAQTEAGELLLRDADYFNRNLRAFMTTGAGRARHFLGSSYDPDADPKQARLSLIDKVIRVYENAAAAFTANPAQRVEVSEVVDDFEKLSTVTPRTIRFIATHPHLLRPSACGRGIAVGGRFYEPQKALVKSRVKSLDTPENRAVLGFLNTVMIAVERVHSELSEDSANMKRRTGRAAGSVGLLLAPLAERVERRISALERQMKSLRRIKTVYQRLLPVPGGFGMLCTELAMPSQIFLRVPQYRAIYDLMASWFRIKGGSAGEPVFAQLFGSRIYELYALTRILESVRDCGFTLKRSFHQEYSEVSGKDPASVTSFFTPYAGHNTFVFERNPGGEPSASRYGDAQEITVWYEPVISTAWSEPFVLDETTGRRKDGAQAERVGLLRTTNLALSWKHNNDTFGRVVQAQTDCFYTPDFVIRARGRDGSCGYLVADAKFSNAAHVLDDLPALVFRYGFSIGTSNPKDRMCGVQILCGLKGGRNPGFDHNVHNVNPQSAAPFRVSYLNEADETRGAGQVDWESVESLKLIGQMAAGEI